MSADANRDGLKMLRREPSLFAMELLWRWSFGLGLLALMVAAYAKLRPALILTEADELALHSQDPVLLAQGLTDLLAPVLPFLGKLCVQLSIWACLLWTIASTVGRGAITRVLVRSATRDAALPIFEDRPRWLSYLLLQFARVVMLLILVVGYLGGAFVAALTVPTNMLAASGIVFVALCLAYVLWSYVNWVLSLAPIFVACDGASPLDAVVEAIGFIGRHRTELRSVAVWNGSLRGAAATVVSLFGVFTVAASAMPVWLSVSLLVVETLVYLLISDALLLARLAAYSRIAVQEVAIVTQAASLTDRNGTSVS